MPDFYHNLTPEQLEILTKISEESAEVIQAISKIQLHGLESIEPDTLGPTNRERLEKELGDLLFFIGLAVDRGILSHALISQAVEARAKRPNQYLHHTEF